MTDSFDNLNLSPNLIKGVYLYGFVEPSKIQIKGITAINTGNDCIIQSQSGTGKTATYLLGVLNRLENNMWCQSIIITPTRELANQVYNVTLNLSKFTNYKISKCIGGINIYENKMDIKNTNVIIGTLGRLFYILNDTKYNIHKLKTIVLDEADELLNNGVNNKLHSILELIPTGTQIILNSATMTLNVFNFSKKYMHNPIKILLKNNEIVIDLISQFYIDIESENQKFDILLDLYNLVSTSQAIIFCNTIEKIKWLDEKLKENNFSITILHSNMTQEERNNVLQDFRNGLTRLLLTTDLLARGIDISQVNMVINYDLPYNKETYIHRIGRCGRFDKKGIAISLVKKSDPYDLKIIHKLKSIYNIDIKEMPESLDNYI